jgi:mono/diheme cytochrome c family protein
MNLKTLSHCQRSKSMTQRIRAAAIVLLAASLGAPVFAQTNTAALYKAKCASCHGIDGLATTPVGKAMKVVSFKAPEMVKASDAQFIAATTNGKGKMPAYKSKLTDVQIKDLVKFIRSLQ